MFAKVEAQEDPRYGLIKDEHIYYLVMNNGDNTFDYDTIEIFNKYLDEIEACEGPAVLVTVGTGDTRFSLGFNMMFWASDIANFLISTP